jgi:hypothetical protein
MTPEEIHMLFDDLHKKIDSIMEVAIHSVEVMHTRERELNVIKPKLEKYMEETNILRSKLLDANF